MTVPETFPDTLPELTEEQREAMNRVLIENLKAWLPWSDRA